MINNDALVNQFKDATKCMDGEFGHNCEFNFLPQLKKLAKLTTIKITNYYSIIVDLPKDPKDLSEVLLFILTKLPGCSTVRTYSNKKDKLMLEWHN